MCVTAHLERPPTLSQSTEHPPRKKTSRKPIPRIVVAAIVFSLACYLEADPYSHYFVSAGNGSPMDRLIARGIQHSITSHFIYI